MKQFLVKKKKINLLYSVPTIIILVLLIIFMFRTLINAYNKKTVTEATVNKAKMELSNLEEAHQKIVSQIEYLESPEGIEAEVRKRFRVGREGEEIAIIVSKDQENIENLSTTSPEKKNIYEKIIDLIGF